MPLAAMSAEPWEGFHLVSLACTVQEPWAPASNNCDLLVRTASAAQRKVLPAGDEQAKHMPSYRNAMRVWAT